MPSARLTEKSPSEAFFMAAVTVWIFSAKERESL